LIHPVGAALKRMALLSWSGGPWRTLPAGHTTAFQPFTKWTAAAVFERAYAAVLRLERRPLTRNARVECIDSKSTSTFWSPQARSAAKEQRAHNLTDSQFIYNGTGIHRLKRFQLVPTGSNWFQLVPTGSNWFQLVPTGSNWFQLVPTGSNWFQLVPTGSNWFQLVPIGSNWFQLVPTGSNWFQLVPTPTGSDSLPDEDPPPHKLHTTHRGARCTKRAPHSANDARASGATPPREGARVCCSQVRRSRP